jgi:hypothetical protein
MITQIPIENHSEQGQFAELPLKTIGKSAKMGDHCAIRSTAPLLRAVSPSVFVSNAINGRSVASCNKNGTLFSVLSLGLCVSRACLGKIIIYINV